MLRPLVCTVQSQVAPGSPSSKRLEQGICEVREEEVRHTQVPVHVGQHVQVDLAVIFQQLREEGTCPAVAFSTLFLQGSARLSH